MISASTEFAAWWGALVASAVLLWDVYKWKTQGPKLVLRLSPNSVVVGDPPYENQTWVSVTVTNVGSQPTTVKGVGMRYFSSYLKRLRNKSEIDAVFPNPNLRDPLPRRLEPGDEWRGLIPQARPVKDTNLESLSQTGHLMIWVDRSDRLRSLQKRLIIS